MRMEYGFNCDQADLQAGCAAGRHEGHHSVNLCLHSVVRIPFAGAPASCPSVVTIPVLFLLYQESSPCDILGMTPLWLWAVGYWELKF